ncbi:uncharacterized protein B0I36DRAFT_381648 [Microdochium trichocladiopsis]|uniref:Zn(2)-C6 fungal-type domain-containing protein n=1 Tax=Microdochium trichocladiopsis TaxID=1682393 RepID=A0A9P8YA87_9PEZI|nr:uncharacterized protein B0I36DRAFT_381648 [Microdochium trichocladiopsis]KAH7034793.1 hypothetical protein B0I36DRAFT_381648 [Microdochium trichocladiopsis]
MDITTANTAETVLRCPQCRKPFDNPSSLKRHGYYCRTRKPIDRASRVHSCLACVSSKVRCDRKRPTCSRCLDKGARCTYTGKPLRESTRQEESRDSLLPNSVGSPSSESSLHPDAGPDEAGNATELGSPILIDFDAGYSAALNWDDTSQDDFAELASPSATGPDVATIMPFSSAKDAISAPAFQSYNTLHLPEFLLNTLPDNTMSIPRTLSTVATNDRSLIHRPTKLKPGSQRAASLIRHTLKSYAVMMLRDNALPPFIHPGTTSLLTHPDTREDLEPLHNCISLLPMLCSQDGLRRSNRTLFWRNVRMECERLCSQFSTLSPLAIVSAMQALSIYIIVRADECDAGAAGGEDNDNIDSLLIMAVVIMSKGLGNAKFADVDGPELGGSASADSLEAAWRRWVLVESARRLCTLYQVVNMVTIFEPAKRCDLSREGLVLSLLPASKQLWEAGDARQWMSERLKMTMKTGSRGAIEYGIALNGDLVNLSSGAALSRSDDRESEAGARRWPKADWEEWLAGMDGFGGLVTLAASMAG